MNKIIHTHHPLRIFFISLLITVAVAIFVGVKSPIQDLWLFLILVILEITFSFDNAVINSKVLHRMSDLWQKLFLTIGIFFAVFVVRFILPIAMVMVSSGKSMGSILNMALNNPAEYGHVLHESAPMINAFGGAFLLMIGMHYFLDRHKDIHWLKYVEKWLSKFGSYESFKILIMLVISLCLYATIHETYQTTVLVASIAGIVLHISLQLFGEYFTKKQSNLTKQVGMAAFASFLYLNVLDASFSLDGVVGAFAISNNILLIMAGLGVGALWVRSITIYLVKSNTLSNYKYLEHGAHWAILALGIIMFAKLYHIEPAEWFTGSIGVLFIATAIVSSILEKRKHSVKTS